MATILYADDDEISRMCMNFFLKHLGHRSILAVSGRDALEKYQTNRQEIGLLLLDMMMPDMNGLVVLREIRKTDPHIRALFCTSAPEAVYRALDDRNEQAEIICKPVELEQLSNMLRHLLEFPP